MAAVDAASRARRCDWRVPAEVVTYGRLEWAINYFAPYKSSGTDGTFPALLQEGWRVVVLSDVLPLILLGRRYESSILFFFAFLLLQEGNVRKQ
jgi:hypothetical protein